MWRIIKERRRLLSLKGLMKIWMQMVRSVKNNFVFPMWKMRWILMDKRRAISRRRA